MKYKSLLYALIAVMFWSTVASAFKLSLQGINYTQLLFYSSATSCIVLLLIYLFSKGGNVKDILSGKNLVKSILPGLLNPFLYYLILFKAYSLLPAHEAQPLNYTWPFVISILSSVFLKQPLSIRSIIGLLVSFFGIIIISTRGDIFTLHFHNVEGTILATGSSLIWGFYWIINLLDKRDALVKLLSSFITGTVFSGIYLYVTGSFFADESIYILGAVYTGIFEMGITFFLWLKALTLSKNNARIASLAYFAPFLSLVFIHIILNERITRSAIIGLIFIIAGILIQQLKSIIRRGSVLSHSGQD